MATAVAIVGAGALAARATKSAAKTGVEGAKDAGVITQVAADRARGDVLDFFPAAQQDLLAGAGAAGDLLTQGIGEQQRLLSAGNVGAQGTLGQGFGQVQNALLGVPVNQQAFAPQQIPLSQLPQNPLAQQAVQTGQPATQGLFSNVANVQPAARAAEIGRITNNRDLISQISTGEISLPGVDTAFWEAVIAQSGPSNTFLQKDSIVNADTPGKLRALLDSTGFNDENKKKLATLVRQVQSVKGSLNA